MKGSFSTPRPNNYGTVSNFKFDLYAFFDSLFGASLLFFFLVSKVNHFSTLSMSEKVTGCSVIILKSKRAELFKLEQVKLIYFIA